LTDGWGGPIDHRWQLMPMPEQGGHMRNLLLSLLLILSVAFGSFGGHLVWADTVVWGN
jgi:hypothetical protein